MGEPAHKMQEEKIKLEPVSFVLKTLKSDLRIGF